MKKKPVYKFKRYILSGRGRAKGSTDSYTEITVEIVSESLAKARLESLVDTEWLSIPSVVFAEPVTSTGSTSSIGTGLIMSNTRSERSWPI